MKAKDHRTGLKHLPLSLPMTRPVAALGLIGAALSLVGCGQAADLKPLPGNAMPPAPYGASSEKTTAELLKLPPQAEPERSAELRSRSEPREDDPFELPPPE